MPPGYSMEWTGLYQYAEDARSTLRVVVPITLAIMFALLLMAFRSVADSSLIMLSAPVRARRRHLPAVGARLFDDHGGHHRLCLALRGGHPDRHHHDRVHSRGAGAEDGGAVLHGRRGRRVGGAAAAEADDRGDDGARPAADHVRHRIGPGYHEADCDADVRRHDQLHDLRPLPHSVPVRDRRGHPAVAERFRPKRKGRFGFAPATRRSAWRERNPDERNGRCGARRLPSCRPRAGTSAGGTEHSTEVAKVRSGNLDVVLLSQEAALGQGKDTATIEFRSASDGSLVDVGTVKASATMSMAGMAPMSGDVSVERTDTLADTSQRATWAWPASGVWPSSGTVPPAAARRTSRRWFSSPQSSTKTFQPRRTRRLRPFAGPPPAAVRGTTRDRQMRLPKAIRCWPERRPRTSACWAGRPGERPASFVTLVTFVAKSSSCSSWRVSNAATIVTSG